MASSAQCHWRQECQWLSKHMLVSSLHDLVCSRHGHDVITSGEALTSTLRIWPKIYQKDQPSQWVFSLLIYIYIYIYIYILASHSFTKLCSLANLHFKFTLRICETLSDNILGTLWAHTGMSLASARIFHFWHTGGMPRNWVHTEKNLETACNAHKWNWLARSCLVPRCWNNIDSLLTAISEIGNIL